MGYLFLVGGIEPFFVYKKRVVCFSKQKIPLGGKKPPEVMPGAGKRVGVRIYKTRAKKYFYIQKT